MKAKIHPQYFSNCKVQCACGAVFEVGSTKENLETEVCFKCHPFYTGKEKMIDTAGRVEKFKQKMAKKKPSKAKGVRKTTKKNNKFPNIKNI